jgi:hypothetical protein
MKVETRGWRNGSSSRNTCLASVSSKPSATKKKKRKKVETKQITGMERRLMVLGRGEQTDRRGGKVGLHS